MSSSFGFNLIVPRARRDGAGPMRIRSRALWPATTRMAGRARRLGASGRRTTRVD
jgi:hypothetical protein